MSALAMTFPRLGVEVTEKKKTLLAILMVFTMLITMVSCTVDQILSDINMLIQTAAVIAGAVSVVNPADGLIVQTLASTATLGLQAVQAAYDTYKASGAQSDLDKVKAAILAIQQNLPQELAAAHITDPESIRMATAWVGLITTTLTAILNLLPNLQVNGKRVKISAGSFPTAKSIKARWSAEVCRGDKECSARLK